MGDIELGNGGYGYNHYYIGGRYDKYPTSATRGTGPVACQFSARTYEVTQPARTVMFTLNLNF